MSLASVTRAASSAQLGSMMADTPDTCSLAKAGVVYYLAPAAFAALGPVVAVSVYLGGAVGVSLARLSYQSWAETK